VHDVSQFRIPALFVGSAFVLMTIGSSSSALADSHTTFTDTVAVMQTKMALRELWVEHVFWIRSYVLATNAGDEAQGEVAEFQVVTNAKALADTIAPFYGEPAADRLLELLADHWGAVRDYHEENIGNSQSGRDAAIHRLTTNASEIAEFLSAANPNLPEQAVFGLLSVHGAHHVAQINQVAAGQFSEEAVTWEAMREHMLTIADAIAEALAMQFPDRF
jgi:hypothetical protein